MSEQNRTLGEILHEAAEVTKHDWEAFCAVQRLVTEAYVSGHRVGLDAGREIWHGVPKTGKLEEAPR